MKTPRKGGRISRHLDSSRHIKQILSSYETCQDVHVLHHIPQNVWPTWNCLQVLLDKSPLRWLISRPSAVRQKVHLVSKLIRIPTVKIWQRILQRREVLTVVLLNIHFFWVVMLCCWGSGYPHLEGCSAFKSLQTAHPTTHSHLPDNPIYW